MCTTDTPTTTTSPCHRTRKCHGAKRNRQTLPTTITRPSTTCRPHSTGRRYSGRHTPLGPQGPFTHTINTKARTCHSPRLTGWPTTTFQPPSHSLCPRASPTNNRPPPAKGSSRKNPRRPSPASTPRPTTDCLIPRRTHTRTTGTGKTPRHPTYKTGNPAPPQAVPAPHAPPPAIPEHLLTARGHPPAATTPALHRRSRPRTLSPRTTKGHRITPPRTQQQRTAPPPPAPQPFKHAAPPPSAPVQAPTTFALHRPPVVQQRLQAADGHQEVLRLRTFWTIQPIWLAALVQGATSAQGIRDFILDAFLHVARQEGATLATPNSERPLPERGEHLSAPVSWGRQHVGDLQTAAGSHHGLQPVLRAQHGPDPTRHRRSQHHGMAGEDLGRPRDLPEQLRGPSPPKHPHHHQPPAGPLHVHDPHIQLRLHPLL